MTEAINVNEIGISKTYKITIPGQEPHTFEGTQESMWKHVADEMAKHCAEGVPDIVEQKAEQTDEQQETPTPTPAPTPARVTPTTHAQARSQGVDQEGAERSTVDLIAAQAAGFAPARPYFDRGTAVIGLGVENARASARDHDAKPRVGDAVSEFCDHIASENRTDVVVPITGLGMRADGTLTGQGGKTWTIEPQALPQLASRLGVEQPGYLSGVWPELRASNWNQHIATAIRHDRSTCQPDHPAYRRLGERADTRVMCRLRDDAKGNPSMWAALSERYATFDVDQIARALEIGMRGQPDARCEITYDGTGATMDVLFHSDVQPERYVAGEFFKAGIRVRTSDSGGGSIAIGLLLWQNLCLNLIMIDVAKYELARLRHIGDSDKLAAKFRQAIGDGNAQLGHFLKAWGYAADEALCDVTSTGVKPEHLRLLDELGTDTISESELLTGIFTGLGKTGAVSIGKNDLPGLLAAHARDNSGAVQVAPVTRASVVNAVTRYAHESIGRVNPTRQGDLEREAGALLVSGRGGNPTRLPFMPPAPVRARA